MLQGVKILDHIWGKLIKYNLGLLLLIGISLFIYSGCSASSNTTRYNRPYNEDKPEKENDIRFSSDDPDIAPADNTLVDIDNLVSKISSPSNSPSKNINLKEKLLMEIIRYMNTPYKYGGITKKGIDCSAFTQIMFKNTVSLDLNRTTRDQYNMGKDISEKDELKFGDLVFFDTRRSVKPGHVGIYLGDNLFAHASSSKGVTISSINSSYYENRFMGGRRVSKF